MIHDVSRLVFTPNEPDRRAEANAVGRAGLCIHLGDGPACIRAVPLERTLVSNLAYNFAFLICHNWRGPATIAGVARVRLAIEDDWYTKLRDPRTGKAPPIEIVHVNRGRPRMRRRGSRWLEVEG